jgi:hypothetical protein
MPMAAHTVIDSNESFKRMTSQASAPREAPAQAELRPTCAGLFRVNLATYLNVNWGRLIGKRSAKAAFRKRGRAS